MRFPIQMENIRISSRWNKDISKLIFFLNKIKFVSSFFFREKSDAARFHQFDKTIEKAANAESKKTAAAMEKAMKRIADEKQKDQTLAKKLKE